MTSFFGTSDAPSRRLFRSGAAATAREEALMLVNVFETIGHAERAVAALLADGSSAGQIAAVETAADAPGLGARLAGHGVPAELAESYEAEVRAGRVLVAVRCHPGDADGARRPRPQRRVGAGAARTARRPHVTHGPSAVTVNPHSAA